MPPSRDCDNGRREQAAGQLPAVWCIHTSLGGWQALKLPRSAGEKVQFKAGTGAREGVGRSYLFQPVRTPLHHIPFSLSPLSQDGLKSGTE